MLRTNPRELSNTRTARVAKAGATVVRSRSVKHVNGFMEFVRTQGVVGLAVGLALGSAVTILIKSLIDNIVMPPIGLMLGSSEGIKGLSLSIGQTDGKETVLNYGTFLNDLINFLVIAVVIYVVVHILNLDRFDREEISNEKIRNRVEETTDS